MAKTYSYVTVRVAVERTRRDTVARAGRLFLRLVSHNTRPHASGPEVELVVNVEGEPGDDVEGRVRSRLEVHGFLVLAIKSEPAE